MSEQDPNADPNPANVTAFPGEAVGGEERHITKNIVIIMPFGGSNPDSEKRFKLQFKRLKYLIEKHIEVPCDKLDATIRYDVKVAMARAMEINRHAFDLIASAEVVIALLTEKNVNVIYELAIRNLIKPTFLMIIKGEPKEVLPVYLHNMEYIKYEEKDELHGHAIRNVIGRLAADPDLHLTWDGDDMPDELASAVDEHDTRLVRDIKARLEFIETSPPTWPEFLRQLAQEQHPGKVFESWISFNPTSIVRIVWRKKASGFEYDPADMIGEPVVCSINNLFAELYDFHYMAFPDPDSSDAMTAAVLLQMIEGYVDPRHMEKFKEDQARVASRLILKDKAGQVQVPLQFNDKHPTMPGKVYLPCLLAKRTIGDIDKPHTTYLVVSYIEDFWPIDHSDNPFSGQD